MVTYQLIYVQAIQAAKGAVARKMHAGARGRKINKYERTWKNFCGKKVLGGNRKGDSSSRYQGRLERQIW